MTANYNPSEPLFDQQTRDFVEVDGDVVMADEDDAQAISNASWYRVLTQKGDCPRDRDAGIDRGLELFNPELPISAGLGAIRSEIMDTPGIASVTDISVIDYSADDRTLYISYAAEIKTGDTINNTANFAG